MCSAIAKKKLTNCSVQLEGLFERYSITKPVAVGGHISINRGGGFFKLGANRVFVKLHVGAFKLD